MKTITIKEKKWRCGADHGKGLTQLKNREGYMCCLGFATGQLKPKISLINLSVPSDTECKIPKLTKFKKCIDTRFAQEAMNINDDENITHEERKEKLVSLFRKNGLKLVFK